MKRVIGQLGGSTAASVACSDRSVLIGCDDGLVLFVAVPSSVGEEDVQLEAVAVGRLRASGLNKTVVTVSIADDLGFAGAAKGSTNLLAIELDDGRTRCTKADPKLRGLFGSRKGEDDDYWLLCGRGVNNGTLWHFDGRDSWQPMMSLTSPNSIESGGFVRDTPYVIVGKIVRFFYGGNDNNNAEIKDVEKGFVIDDQGTLVREFDNIFTVSGGETAIDRDPLSMPVMMSSRRRPEPVHLADVVHAPGINHKLIVCSPPVAAIYDAQAHTLRQLDTPVVAAALSKTGLAVFITKHELYVSHLFPRKELTPPVLNDAVRSIKKKRPVLADRNNRLMIPPPKSAGGTKKKKRRLSVAVSPSDEEQRTLQAPAKTQSEPARVRPVPEAAEVVRDDQDSAQTLLFLARSAVVQKPDDRVSIVATPQRAAMPATPDAAFKRAKRPARVSLTAASTPVGRQESTPIPKSTEQQDTPTVGKKVLRVSLGSSASAKKIKKKAKKAARISLEKREEVEKAKKADPRELEIICEEKSEAPPSPQIRFEPKTEYQRIQLDRAERTNDAETIKLTHRRLYFEARVAELLAPFGL